MPELRIERCACGGEVIAPAVSPRKAPTWNRDVAPYVAAHVQSDQHQMWRLRVATEERVRRA